ncbi:hypothetical protein F5Y04DRAFT_77218 [Hypomontagnella monticulosa]|nr:hypothetical protein F5Y04DRAFT_77218 [Hypomontagnella monticulosa]
MDNVAVDASWRKSPSPGSEAQEKYQCPRCPSSFKRPEHLKRHQRSHDGHKPFVCSVCLKRFFRSDILTRHELMHVAAQRNTHTLNRKRACTECARARERCSRDEPCQRCSTKSLQCLYPDDAGQRAHSLNNEASTSSMNEIGQLEDYSQLSSQGSSILQDQESFMLSNSMQRRSLNEDDAPLREFIHNLRSPTTSSFAADPDRASSSSNLLYKSSAFHHAEKQPHSALGLDNTNHSGVVVGNEAGGFEAERLEAGRQAPLFDQPARSSFSRARIHDAITLDEPRFGQALGEYSHLCPPPASADPPFDFHSEAMSSSAEPPRAPAGGAGAGARDTIDPFLASIRDPGGLSPTLSANAAAAASSSSSAGALLPPGLLSDFGSSRPINLKAYELIASNFQELCLEHGEGAAAAAAALARGGSNISESQRTAQHELFVKLYYEHFKREAY